MSYLKRGDGFYRSMFEKVVCSHLEDNQVDFEYESLVIPYNIPQQNKTYTPDLVLSNGIIIEIKGELTKESRAKHLLIKQQRPDLDIRFVLQNSNNRLYKTSKTTYSDWLENNNFIWASRLVPLEWVDEKPKKINTTELFVKNTVKPTSGRPFTRYQRGRK